MQALGDAKTPAAKVAVVQILGNIPTAESLEALRKAVGNDDAGVSLAAVQAISAWPNGAVTSDLKGLLTSAKSSEARGAAIGGYVRLVREAKLPAADALAAYEEALKAAQTPAEKKPVIAALATVPSKHAVELLESLKGDAALATDAGSGIVSVARLVSGSDPSYAKEKITPYGADDQPEAIKKPAKAALGLIDAFGDYITAWQVSGPYFEAGKDARELFEMQFAPENAPKDAKWSIAPMANARPDSPELKPWTVDLGAIFEDQERVAYLRTTLDSAKDQDLVLELGTNDGCKAWLNGKQIHAWKEGRVLTPGQDKVPVTLKQGKNELMIAVYQQGGGWAACARLATKDGKPAADVKATIE